MGCPVKDRVFAKVTQYNKIASLAPRCANVIVQNKLSSGLLKAVLGVHPKRSLPKVNKPFSNTNNITQETSIKTVYLFIDEFTNYMESHIASDTKLVLESLGYKVIPIHHLESGRAQISKGFLKQARKITNKTIHFLKDLVDENFYLIGIEPSAIFTFKDEFIKLADDKSAAKFIAERSFLIEEFIQQEIQSGHITSNQFTREEKTIKFHGHCHQKALVNQKSSFDVLNLPENYKVTIIPSGCCGMAGSFGYQKDNYDVSMQIGEQTLFPSIRKSNNDVIIAANGTSCRHQIKDGTGKAAKHPITVLKEALAVS